MEELSWAQIYLLLDGAQYNAPLPIPDDDDDSPDVPDPPSLRDDPVGFLEWELRHSPMASAFNRRSDDEIKIMCAKFAGEIERGEKVWDESKKRWVKA